MKVTRLTDIYAPPIYHVVVGPVTITVDAKGEIELSEMPDLKEISPVEFGEALRLCGVASKQIKAGGGTTTMLDLFTRDLSHVTDRVLP